MLVQLVYILGNIVLVLPDYVMQTCLGFDNSWPIRAL